MTILADINTYWTANPSLNAAIPATSVYTLQVPTTFLRAYPYGTITPIACVPTPTTGAGYIETYSFQISLWHSDPDILDALANTVTGQFDYQPVGGDATISCERSGGPVLTIDNSNPGLAFMAVITYDLRVNKSLPDN
jgi:hypothetical protein